MHRAEATVRACKRASWAAHRHHRPPAARHHRPRRQGRAAPAAQRRASPQLTVAAALVAHGAAHHCQLAAAELPKSVVAGAGRQQVVNLQRLLLAQAVRPVLGLQGGKEEKAQRGRARSARLQQ